MKWFQYLTVGRVPKGEAFYMADQKRRRLLITAILFAVPLLIFFTCWGYFGTRNTVWTIIAVVGCLPACKQLVGLIMIWPRPSIDQDLYGRLKEHQGKVVMAYEMYMTFYEKSAWLDAFAVCGTNVVLYTHDATVDGAYICSHAKDILKGNGYRADVRLMVKEDAFIERLDYFNNSFDACHEGLKERPDDRYEGMNRDEVVREVLLALCL